jgi:FkbM family methyltransferase
MTDKNLPFLRQATSAVFTRGYRFFRRILYFLTLLPAQIQALQTADQLVQIDNRLGRFYARPFTDTVKKTDQKLKTYLHHWVTDAPEGVFIDIGADVGLFSFLSLKRGNAKSVVAFEPNPSVYPLLVKNVAANDLPVKAVHAGVSRSAGSMTLAPNTVHTNTTTTCGGSGVNIDSIDLDTFLQNEEIAALDIGCIKISLEGHELPALEGMQKTLHNMTPNTHLFVEISEYGKPADKTRAFIKWNGFKLADSAGKNYLYKKV